MTTQLDPATVTGGAMSPPTLVNPHLVSTASPIDEKNFNTTTGATDLEADRISEHDADGEVKQDGVRRTEAITATWDKKTLVLIFVSCVLISPNGVPPMLHTRR